LIQSDVERELVEKTKNPVNSSSKDCGNFHMMPATLI